MRISVSYSVDRRNVDQPFELFEPLYNYVVGIIFNKWWPDGVIKLRSNFVSYPGAYCMPRSAASRMKGKKNSVREITDERTLSTIEERNFYEGTTNLLRILNSRQAIHTAAMYSR